MPQARDMNVLTVNGFGKTNPVIPFPYYNSEAPCVRWLSSSPGGWACRPPVVSNGISAPASYPLQDCTYWPYQL